MRRATIPVLVLAAFLPALSQSVLAQAQSEPAHPDFSGTWKPNLAKSKLSKKSTGDLDTIVIKGAGNSVELGSPSDSEQIRVIFIADGKEHAMETSGGEEFYSQAEWKNSVLFIKICLRVVTPGVGTNDFLLVEQSWSISPDGRVLTFELEDPKQTFFYDKQ